MTDSLDEARMRRVLELAARAGRSGEVPVGAMVVDSEGRVLAESANACEAEGDPTAHAEMITLRRAVAVSGSSRLAGAVLYCNVEPCAMCAGALVLARIGRLVYGCRQPKFGGVFTRFGIGLGGSGLNHAFAVEEGLLEAESRALLAAFFEERR